MELKLYLRMIMAKWWLILAAFVITLIPTIVLVNRQPWVYESDTTFVIRPRASISGEGDEQFVDAVDTLSRRVEINTTFAEVASSSLIKQRAIQRLDLSSEERSGLKVNSRVIAGTNVLYISVQGPDPNIVRDFNEAVSIETVNYVSGLYDVFELEPLDIATLPNNPISPNKPLNLAVGGAFGLLLGIVLIFVLEYLKEPLTDDVSFNIIDLETGAYNQPYFMLRLRQELSRAWRNRYSLSVALIEVNHRKLASGAAQQVAAGRALPQITQALGSNLRDEDIVAHLGYSRFALLLPDMPGEAAKDLLEDMRAKIALLSPEEAEDDKGQVVYSSVGIADYRNEDVSDEEILIQATQALEEASASTYGKVALFASSTDKGSTKHSQNGIKLHTKERSLRKVVESRKVSP